MKHLAYVCLGLPVSFVVLSFAIGGPVNAAAFIFITVVCTAGSSLALWIPMWWGIGLFLCKVVLLLRGPDLAGEMRKSAGSPSWNREELALTNYVRLARVSGMDQVEIKRRLRETGWPDAKIDGALSTDDRPGDE